MENATAKKTSLSFAYPENANHVLKHEEKPREELNAQNVSLNYNAPDAELDNEASNTILDWLRKHAQK